MKRNFSLPSFTFGIWLSAWALLASSVWAVDWQLHRFEGRDYVSVDNIATFYGLPAPPALPKPPPPTAPLPTPASTAPTDAASPSPAPDAAAAALAAAATTLATPAVPLPRTIALDSGKRQLEFTVNSREVLINGAKHWLAFPSVAQDGKLLISRLDLSRIIEPRLRPENIEGLKPFTRVVLDPGHGGHDKGAASRFGYEKDFALDVAKRARTILESRGYTVAMTRTTDVFIPLHERPKLAANDANTIFVSIHFNATMTNPDARGFEIFSIAPRGAPATNDPGFKPRDLREEPGNAHELPSGALAGTIYHSLLGQVPTLDRGLKHARFAVLRLARVPAVLVECGFVTNGPESALIGSAAWRGRVAEAIVEGIDEYKLLTSNKQPPKHIADYRRAAAAAPGATGTTP